MKLKVNQICIIIFLTFTFLYTLRSGVVLSPDSTTYMDYGLLRIGLYPLTISLFRLIFQSHALEVLVGFQLFFTIAGSYLLARFLQRTFNLPSGFHFGFLAIFLLPVIVFKCANDILSEGLAYPLFLITSYFFLKGVLEKNIRDLLIFCLTLFLLTFTRQQYIFFYGVAFAAGFYFLLAQKDFHKKGVFFLSLALSLGAFFVSERAYHYVFHGSFSGTPFTGIQLFVRPIFLGTEDSYKGLSDPKQQEFTQKAMDHMIHQNIFESDPAQRQLDRYNLVYNPMQAFLIDLAYQTWPKNDFDDPQSKIHTEFEYAQFINKQTTILSLNLIKNNLSSYSQSYVKDVMRGFGGYTLFGFVLFTSLLCLWGILWQHRITQFSLSFIMASLSHLGNLSLICLFQPPLIRYTYSTGALLFCMLLIMAYRFMQQNLLSNADQPCVA